MLICRLDDPGNKDRCLNLWQAVAPRLHDKVSILFVYPQSVLWPHVNATQPDGSGISDLLRQELKALKLCPLDDAVNEWPHAQAARIAHHARLATWPWVASTQRLAQNFADIAELPSVCNEDLQQLWLGYKRVIPANTQVRRNKFETNLYHMEHCREGMGGRKSRNQAGDNGGDDDDRGGDDPADGGDDPEFHPSGGFDAGPGGGGG